MANHPVNLGFRFMLEIFALSAFAFWGWAWDGWIRWPLAAALALGAMAIWDTFRTQGDHPAGKRAIPTPGRLRLAIELAFFGLAVLALLTADANERAGQLGVVLGIAVAIHYALSWDRVGRLLSH